MVTVDDKGKEYMENLMNEKNEWVLGLSKDQQIASGLLK